MSAPENTTYMTLLEELTPDLERADAAETPQDLLEAIQDAQDRTERFPVAHPERVETWYRNAYKKDLRDWIEMPLLEPSEAGHLIFGRRPDGPSVVRVLDSLAQVKVTPGTGTPLAFAKLIERTVLDGKLAWKEDPDGEILITPQNAFRLALARGVKMQSSLRAAWKEIIEEQASVAESEAHEQSEHPSEIQMATEEPKKNIRAEWCISGGDDSLFFRTFTDEVLDGVAEFKLGTKNQVAMSLLCQRHNEGVSIRGILEAVYPDDLAKWQMILKEAPPMHEKDARIEYFKRAGVHDIMKKAKQICRTVRDKLKDAGIPEEALEVLPTESLLCDDPLVSMAFLRVQELQEKSANVVKMRPGIMGAPEVSEYTKNAASRPDF